MSDAMVQCFAGKSAHQGILCGSETFCTYSGRKRLHQVTSASKHKLLLGLLIMLRCRFCGGALGDRAGGGTHRDECGRGGSDLRLLAHACKLPPLIWQRDAMGNDASNDIN
eukprot:1159381-Pelagomonas_calceolata.AAC.21